MHTCLVTGGAGFFGGILVRRLLETGYRCVSIDLQAHDYSHPNLTAVQGDVRDRELLSQLCEREQPEVIFHCAAILAHGKEDHAFLWSSNVDGTRSLAEAGKRIGVRQLIYISTNCLWAENLRHPIREDEPPAPAEIYGRSKLEGERILEQYAGAFDLSILRCPTIIDSGRLGLLAILFEFIWEGRKVWAVGGGHNRYQFIYARDLADGCMRLMKPQPGVFHIGADNTKSLREVYSYVIDRAGSRSRVASLPKAPTLFAMKVAYKLGLSPLGPYHYKMIAEDFEFDTSKLKRAVGWQPTLTGEEILLEAYVYYKQNREEILARHEVSAHRQAAKMGVIRLLKWLS